jgi:uncharacterized protein (UPF0335 family)
MAKSTAHQDNVTTLPALQQVNPDDLKKARSEIMKAEEEKDAANGHLRHLYAKWKERGIDPDAMKIVVSLKKRGKSPELMEKVNDYLDKLGEQLHFHFNEAA